MFKSSNSLLIPQLGKKSPHLATLQTSIELGACSNFTAHTHTYVYKSLSHKSTFSKRSLKELVLSRDDLCHFKWNDTNFQCQKVLFKEF